MCCWSTLKCDLICYHADVSYECVLLYVPNGYCSLLCGPISSVVNLEMSSTARFFCGNAIYGCSGLGNCRMLNLLSIAFCVIDLISMLIR